MNGEPSSSLNVFLSDELGGGHGPSALITPSCGANNSMHVFLGWEFPRFDAHVNVFILSLLKL